MHINQLNTNCFLTMRESHERVLVG